MPSSSGVTRPSKELFGTFGPVSTFERYREPSAFDRVLEGPTITVGIRDPAVGMHGRSSVTETEHGVCAIWGEVFSRTGADTDPATWLLEAYERDGTDALSGLNGSFLAVVDHVDREAIVATDPIRSWECYYADAPAARCFGTDAATVARTVPSPTVASDPLDEFLALGVVLDDRTPLQELSRIPFDSYLTASTTNELERFVYDPCDFDYATELAARLERAFERRSDIPGRKGVLLSAGYDSRAVLSGIPDVEVAYTIGSESDAEVEVARDIAAQYGVSHSTLAPGESYLNTEIDDLQYSHGMFESLHAHHASYVDQMDVTTMYHGTFADSLLRGHFLPLEGLDVLGHELPPYRLSRDPDVADHLLEKFGYLSDCHRLAPMGSWDESTHEAFVRRRITDLVNEWSDRFDGVYDGMTLFGIQNQPARPFRYHLADHFVESCVMLDAELIEWHLSTPPEHRNTQTFLRALRKLDDDLLRHRPPDRPTDSFTVNQVTSFVRRKLPVFSGYGGPWPDREVLYEQTGLDREKFGDCPEARELPWRMKLRINDATTWLNSATVGRPVRPTEFVEGGRDERRSSDLLTG